MEGIRQNAPETAADAGPLPTWSAPPLNAVKINVGASVGLNFACAGGQVLPVEAKKVPSTEPELAEAESVLAGMKTRKVSWLGSTTWPLLTASTSAIVFFSVMSEYARNEAVLESMSNREHQHTRE